LLRFVRSNSTEIFSRCDALIWHGSRLRCPNKIAGRRNLDPAKNDKKSKRISTRAVTWLLGTDGNRPGGNFDLDDGGSGTS